MSARIPCTIYAALCKGTVVFIVSHDMFLEHLLDGALGACVTPPTPPGQRYFDNAIFHITITSDALLFSDHA